jgi:predicted small integral membrane protein
LNSIEFILLFQSTLGVGLACVAVACGVYFVMLKRSVGSPFDPLFLGAAAHAFAAAVVVYLVAQQLIASHFVASFVATEFAFWIGFFVVRRPVQLARVSREQVVGHQAFRRFYVSCISIFLFSLIVFIGKAGLLITQDVSRLIVMQQLGWVSWLYDGSLFFATVLVLMKRHVIGERARADWPILAAVVFAVATKGGKSDFILVCFSVYLVGAVFAVRPLMRALNALYVIAPAALYAVTAAILNVWGAETSVVEALLGRMILFGDVFFQAYDTAAFDALPRSGFWSYFFGSITDAVSRALGYMPEPRTVLGYELSNYYYGVDEGIGANARHNVLGLYLFGFAGSIVFSFVCGVFVSLVRARTLRGPQSAVRIALYLVANIAVVYVMIDPALAVGYFIKVGIVAGLSFAGTLIMGWRDARTVSGGHAAECVDG